jgi:hypothetical protein
VGRRSQLLTRLRVVTVLVVTLFVMTVLDLDVAPVRLEATPRMATVHASAPGGRNRDAACGAAPLAARRQDGAPTRQLTDVRSHAALDSLAGDNIAPFDQSDSARTLLALCIATVID